MSTVQMNLKGEVVQLDKKNLKTIVLKSNFDAVMISKCANWYRLSDLTLSKLNTSSVPYQYWFKSVTA